MRSWPNVSLNGGWLVERRASCIVFLAPLLVAFLAINTVVMLFTQLYAYADEPGGDVYLHGDLIWCGETPECKQSMAMCRGKVGLQVRLVPKSNTRRLSYECWQGAQNLHRPGALPAGA